MPDQEVQTMPASMGTPVPDAPVESPSDGESMPVNNDRAAAFAADMEKVMSEQEQEVSTQSDGLNPEEAVQQILQEQIAVSDEPEKEAVDKPQTPEADDDGAVSLLFGKKEETPDDAEPPRPATIKVMHKDGSESEWDSERILQTIPATNSWSQVINGFKEDPEGTMSSLGAFLSEQLGVSYQYPSSEQPAPMMPELPEEFKVIVEKGWESRVEELAQAEIKRGVEKYHYDPEDPSLLDRANEKARETVEKEKAAFEEKMKATKPIPVESKNIDAEVRKQMAAQHEQFLQRKAAAQREADLRFTDFAKAKGFDIKDNEDSSDMKALVRGVADKIALASVHDGQQTKTDAEILEAAYTKVTGLIDKAAKAKLDRYIAKLKGRPPGTERRGAPIDKSSEPKVYRVGTPEFNKNFVDELVEGIKANEGGAT